MIDMEKGLIFWVLILLFDDVYAIVLIVYDSFSVKWAHRVDPVLIFVEILGTKQVIHFLSLFINKESVMVDGLLNCGEA